MVSGTYGGWCRWSRVGTELHQSWYQAVAVGSEMLCVMYLKKKKLPGFSPPTILQQQGKQINKLTPTHKTKPNPITLNPQQKSSRLSPQKTCFYRWSISTSAGQLPTTHPRAFYSPAPGWVFLKYAVLIDFISQFMFFFFSAIYLSNITQSLTISCSFPLME